MKLKYIISLSALIIMLPVIAQQEPVAVTKQSKFEVGLDVMGLTILPIAWGLSGKDNSRFRVALNGVYHLNNRFFLDATFGTESIKQSSIDENVYDYEMVGVFFSTTGSIYISKRAKFYAGFGFVFSGNTHSGNIRLKGNFYRDYVRTIDQRAFITAVQLKIGKDFSLTERLKLKAEIKLVLGGVSEDSDKIMPVYSAAGVGYNGFQSTGPIIAIPTYVYLSYSF